MALEEANIFSRLKKKHCEKKKIERKSNVKGIKIIHSIFTFFL